MLNDTVDNYFSGVAAKYLSAVDADPARSNGHEIGGLPSVGFKQHLGTPSKDEEYRFRTRQIYISDESAAPTICDGFVTWYDSRKKSPHRRPEYRLYYYDSSVTDLIQEGDFFLIAKLKSDAPIHRLSTTLEPDRSPIDLLMVFTPQGSAIEHQLRAIFGLSPVDSAFSAGKLDSGDLLLPLRMLLEDLGLDVGERVPDADLWLEKLVARFGGLVFPSTAEFSNFSRETLIRDLSPLEDPDGTIISWMEREEELFRIYERHIVQERLKDGFGKDGEDVDGFINFSLSVQNRRKSRVGHAFENHLDSLFRWHGLKFEQGRGKGKVTENNSRPDFIFPSFASYHDPAFPASSLLMLGAKTTCKDRWRQVLSEAERISQKHLATLEAAITEKQTEEMWNKNLELVIPSAIHQTYTHQQRTKLLSLANFIEMVKDN